MAVQVLVQDNTNGNIYDISGLVTDLSIETSLEPQPSKLTLNFVDDGKASIREGSPLMFKYDGLNMFYGYIFTHEITQKGKISITAYDQSRYLKTKDSYVFSGMTASQVFSKICQDFGIRYKIINPSSYILPPKAYDDKSLWEIFQDCLDMTLMNANEMYCIRDNFGTLEFAHMESYKTKIFIGDGSHATDFTYKSSIDDEVYNRVKLVQIDKENKKKNIYIVEDSNNIAKWGKLQYFEKVDEKMNDSQIKAKAHQILQAKNRLKRTISMEALGDGRIRAGSGIFVGLEDLKQNGVVVNNYFIVSKCTQKWEGNKHNMSLELMMEVD